MSASNLQALSILLERAEAERDDALRALKEASQRADAARAQHGELAQYRQDYQQRWGQQFARQGHIAVHADQRVERARAVLMEREMRVASVRKLLERRRFDLARSAQRQEQKAMDEQAARAALSANNPFARLSA
jgi:flagellar FliJ protein